MLQYLISGEWMSYKSLPMKRMEGACSLKGSLIVIRTSMKRLLFMTYLYECSQLYLIYIKILHQLYFVNIMFTRLLIHESFCFQCCLQWRSVMKLPIILKQSLYMRMLQMNNSEAVIQLNQQTAIPCFVKLNYSMPCMTMVWLELELN